MAFSAKITLNPVVINNLHPNGGVHRWTSWQFVRVSDGAIVHSSLWDIVNLLAYTTPILFEKDIEYLLHISVGDWMNFESPGKIIPFASLTPPIPGPGEGNTENCVIGFPVYQEQTSGVIDTEIVVSEGCGLVAVNPEVGNYEDDDSSGVVPVNPIIC